MSSGLVIETLSAGCTPITYYSANNNEVKCECDLGWLDTVKGEESEEVSHGVDLSTSMNYDQTLIQNKVFIHSVVQQDGHYGTISNGHIGYCHGKGKGGFNMS